MVGTSLYLAPEVREGRIYNSKADVYSFGFVLWELWYAKRAFQTETPADESYLDLLEKVRQGRLPSHIEGTNHPWEMWQHVMTNCWNVDPRSRLTAGKGLECLKQLHAAEIEPKLKQRPTPPPRPPSTRLHSQSKKPPPTKPKPSKRPIKQEGTFVSYRKNAEEESVYFRSEEKN